MSKPLLSFQNIAPPLSDFVDLRAKSGWGKLDAQTAQKTLSGGIVNVTIFEGEDVLGFGRVIGDGAIYFYIQDLIVREENQGQGLGAKILQNLIDQTQVVASPGASIGLMSAVEKESFYEKFGFVNRPNFKFGSGMTLLLGQ